MAGFLDKILSLIFPASCLGCGRSGEFFCAECLGGLPLADHPEEDFIYSVFNYRDRAVKSAIWTLKYRGRHSIAAILARAMSDKLSEELADLATMENFADPVLVPIPLSAGRLKERGFNQAQRLAEELARISGLEMMSNVLAKTKETKNQARIRDKSERLKNLKGAFEIKNPGLVEGRNMILIDDVSTTGATLTEAKKILEKAGAKKVIALTLAH